MTNCLSISVMGSNIIISVKYSPCSRIRCIVRLIR